MNKINWLPVYLILLLSSFQLHPEQTLSFRGGAELVEEAYASIYRSQLTPLLSLTYKGTKRFLKFKMENSLSTELLLWPFFFKNEGFYYDNSSLALAIPLEYSLTFRLPANRRAAFLTGFSLRGEARWDRYSLGRSYSYSELRLTPLLPLVNAGLYLKPCRLLEIVIREQLGATVNMLLFFSRGYYRAIFYQVYIYHSLQAELIFRLGARHSLLFGYRNSIRVNQSISDYHSTIFFRNLIYLGVRYEF